MSYLFHIVFGVLAVVLAFGFIIFIHELGHFLAARAVDIRCPQFAIGFGPQLFGFRFRGTNFAVRLFPLGGYVMMNGEEPEADKADPWAKAVSQYLALEPFPATPAKLLERMNSIEESERDDSWRDVYDQLAFAKAKEFPSLRAVEGNFHDRSIPARILVLSGGVLMNFLATICLFWLLAPIAGLGSLFNGWQATISQVQPGMPAALAGIRPGDRIVAIDGHAIETHLEAFDRLSQLGGTSIELELMSERGVKSTKRLTPNLTYGGESFLFKDGAIAIEASNQHPELVGKKIGVKGAGELLALMRSQFDGSYKLEVEGKQISFKVPEAKIKPRGQIGVLFGSNEIYFEDRLTAIVGEVKPNSPAALAGVQPGDRLYAVGGWNGYTLVSGIEEGFGSLVDPALKAYARLGRKDLPLIVLRGDSVKELEVKIASDDLSLSNLGLSLRPLQFSDKVMGPFVMIGNMLRMPYDIFSAWFSKRATGKEIMDSMSGPVGIMGLIYDISDNGLLPFVFFVGLLNAAIGAFNLLPFPALDGARLLFLFVAFLRGGRQIDPEKEAKVHMLGLLILLLFVVVVTFGDVKKLIASHLFVL